MNTDSISHTVYSCHLGKMTWKLLQIFLQDFSINICKKYETKKKSWTRYWPFTYFNIIRVCTMFITLISNWVGAIPSEVLHFFQQWPWQYRTLRNECGKYARVTYTISHHSAHNCASRKREPTWLVGVEGEGKKLFIMKNNYKKSFYFTSYLASNCRWWFSPTNGFP